MASPFFTVATRCFSTLDATAVQACSAILHPSSAAILSSDSSKILGAMPRLDILKIQLHKSTLTHPPTHPPIHPPKCVLGIRFSTMVFAGLAWV